MSEDGPGGRFSWVDEQLKHPGGRATGGEPCVQCTEPVPPGAHWKHRDRHVCGERCNYNLMRKFNRRAKKEGLRPPKVTNPRTRPRPYVFSRVPGAFPLEFDGWSPQPGDTALRYGSTMTYHRLDAGDQPGWIRREIGDGRPVVAAVHFETGAMRLTSLTADETIGSLQWAEYWPDSTEWVGMGPPFEHDGRRWHWVRELIRHVLPDGREYTWDAPLCVPVDVLADSVVMWTPEYQAQSEQRRRTSASTGQHARRLRMIGPDGHVERIDPREVYEACGWLCGLCKANVDPTVPHPDPLSASLDHIVPLAAGGQHTRDNVQLAHLRCNMSKGARVG